MASPEMQQLFFSLQSEVQKEKVGLHSGAAYEHDSEVVIRHYPLYKQQILDYIRGESDKLVTILPVVMDEEFKIVYFDHLRKFFSDSFNDTLMASGQLLFVLEDLHKYAPEETELFLYDIFLSFGDHFTLKETSQRFKSILFNALAQFPNFVTHFSTKKLKDFLEEMREVGWDIKVGYALQRELYLRGDADMQKLAESSLDEAGEHLNYLELDTFIILSIEADNFEAITASVSNYNRIVYAFEYYCELTNHEDIFFSQAFFDFFDKLEDDRLAMEIAYHVMQVVPDNGQSVPERFKNKIISFFKEELKPKDGGLYSDTHYLFDLVSLNTLVGYFLDDDTELRELYIKALAHYKDTERTHRACSKLAPYLAAGEEKYQRLSGEYLDALGFSSDKAQLLIRASFFEENLLTNSLEFDSLLQFYQTILTEDEIDSMLLTIFNFNLSLDKTLELFAANEALFFEVVDRFFLGESVHKKVRQGFKNAVQVHMAQNPHFRARIDSLTNQGIFDENVDTTEWSDVDLLRDDLTLAYETYEDERDPEKEEVDKEAILHRKYINDVGGVLLPEQITTLNEILARGVTDKAQLIKQYRNYQFFRRQLYSLVEPTLTDAELRDEDSVKKAQELHAQDKKDLDEVWAAIQYNLYDVLEYNGVHEAVLLLVSDFLQSDEKERLSEELPRWIEAVIETGTADILVLFSRYAHLKSRDLWNYVSSAFSKEELTEFLGEAPSVRGKLFDTFLSSSNSEAVLPLLKMFMDAETRQDVDVEKNLEQEAHIRELEEKLGISTDKDRFRESTLCVNTDLLVAHSFANAGMHLPVERMYGHDYWEEWLQGRVFLEEHQDEDLSMDLLFGLFEAVSLNDSAAQKLRFYPVINPMDREIKHNEMVGIQSSGNVCLLDIGEQPTALSRYESRNHKGVIIYPTVHSVAELEKRFPLLAENEITQEAKDHYARRQIQLLKRYEKDGVPIVTNRQLTTAMLEEVVAWYADQLKDKNVNPYTLAHDLQRKFAEIHPLEDRNGRISRLLMNWSLKKHGKSPAFAGSEEEYFTPISTQQKEVEVASKQYQMLASVQRELQGLESQIAFLRVLFNEEDDRGFVTFQREMNKIDFKIMQICFKGEMTEEKQELLRQVVLNLREEYRVFVEEAIHKAEFYRAWNEDYPFILTPEGYEVIDIPSFIAKKEEKGTAFVLQDSFAPVELEKIMTARPDRVQLGTTFAGRELVRSLYLTKEKMFKGGYFVKSDEFSIDNFLRMFSEAVGAGASYRTADESDSTTSSFEPVTPHGFLIGQKVHNKILKKKMRAKIAARRDRKNVKDTASAKMLHDHIQWNSSDTEDSCFTSFSKGFRTAYTYSQGRLGERHDDSGQQQNYLRTKYRLSRGQISQLFGIVIEASIPKEGFHDVVNVDSEVLVSGAILPESVTALSIYDDLNNGQTIYDADDPQVELNNKYYGTGSGRSVLGADPLPIKKPIMELRRYTTEDNEYIVVTDYRKGKEEVNIFGFSAGRFVRLSSGYSKEVKEKLGV